MTKPFKFIKVDKPWAKLRISKAQYLSVKPWKAAKMSREQFETILFQLSEEAVQSLHDESDAEKLLAAAFAGK